MRLVAKTCRSDFPSAASTARRNIAGSKSVIRPRASINPGIKSIKPYLIWRKEFHTNYVRIVKNNVFYKYGGWEYSQRNNGKFIS
jgi:hypothetical protein